MHGYSNLNSIITLLEYQESMGYNLFSINKVDNASISMLFID